jgi:hypothetical protein
MSKLRTLQRPICWSFIFTVQSHCTQITQNLTLTENSDIWGEYVTLRVFCGCGGHQWLADPPSQDILSPMHRTLIIMGTKLWVKWQRKSRSEWVSGWREFRAAASKWPAPKVVLHAHTYNMTLSPVPPIALQCESNKCTHCDCACIVYCVIRNSYLYDYMALLDRLVFHLTKYFVCVCACVHAVCVCVLVTHDVKFKPNLYLVIKLNISNLWQ